MADSYDRFRSFAERYVIERATHFAKGKEREEAWTATMDAKTIYKNIAMAAKDAEDKPLPQQPSSYGQGQANPPPSIQWPQPQPPGITGPMVQVPVQQVQVKPLPGVQQGTVKIRTVLPAPNSWKRFLYGR